MKARLGAATAAVLAMCGSLTLARADGQVTGDPQRARAEELAQAASERFGEILHPQRVAQAQNTKAPTTRTDATDDDPWSAATRWLERSGREYQGLVQRLAQANEPKASGQGPATAPAEKKSEPGVFSPKKKPAEESSDWLTQSSERFQMLMRKLAERAAPPDTEAEKRRAAEAATKGEKEKAGSPAATSKVVQATPSTEKNATDKNKSTEAPKTEEERRLAETRRAEAAKRAEEVRKTEEVLKAEQAKKAEDDAKADAAKVEQARKVAEAKKAEDDAKAGQAKKAIEAKKADDARKAEEAAKAEQARKVAEAKKAEDNAKAEQARKAAEAKKADEAAKAEQAKKLAEAMKADEARKAEAAIKAEEARKAAEAKKTADARKAGDAAKADQDRKAAEAKKAEDEERKRVEARRLAKEKAEIAEQTRRAVDHRAASQIARELSLATEDPPRKTAESASGSAIAGKTETKEKMAEAEKKVAEAPQKSDAAKADAPKAGAAKKPAAEEPKKSTQSSMAAATSSHVRTTRHAHRSGSSRRCEDAGADVSLPGWYIVKQGDTLWDIAERHYKAGWRYKRIFAANRKRLRSAHWIMPCQRLYLPAVRSRKG
jgi:nucleoid-associated protein YgaU